MKIYINLRNTSIFYKHKQAVDVIFFSLSLYIYIMTSTISNTVPPSADDQVPLSLDICADLPKHRAIISNCTEYIRNYNSEGHEGPYNFR